MFQMGLLNFVAVFFNSQFYDICGFYFIDDTETKQTQVSGKTGYSNELISRLDFFLVLFYRPSLNLMLPRKQRKTNYEQRHRTS